MATIDYTDTQTLKHTIVLTGMTPCCVKFNNAMADPEWLKRTMDYCPFCGKPIARNITVVKAYLNEKSQGTQGQSAESAQSETDETWHETWQA